MRLINVDTLIDEIRKDTEVVIEQDDKAGSFWLGYIAGLVIKQPTIQYEPHEGHWIKLTGMMPPEYFGKHECSKCKYLISGSKVEEYYYCPHCGAKMRRENC